MVGLDRRGMDQEVAILGYPAVRGAERDRDPRGVEGGEAGAVTKR